MVIRYTCKRMCIYKLILQVQRKYMGYIVKYFIIKCLIYKTMQILESNKCKKVYKHAKRHAQLLKVRD